MFIVPKRIPGSKVPLSDTITVSILIDRSLFLEVGRAVLVILNSEEAAALLEYLQKHSRKFQVGK